MPKSKAIPDTPEISKIRGPFDRKIAMHSSLTFKLLTEN